MNGDADLSRRCIPYDVQGMSFREYLEIVNDRYELGAATVSEKLKAQTELQKAQVDRITAMCDLNLAVTSYKKAMSLE